MHKVVKNHKRATIEWAEMTEKTTAKKKAAAVEAR
jgi:hypothetical protein